MTIVGVDLEEIERAIRELKREAESLDDFSNEVSNHLVVSVLRGSADFMRAIANRLQGAAL